MTTDALVVLCTCSAESAPALARRLVQERLAACVNSLPVASTYRWEGAVQEDEETLLLIKTTRETYPRLEERIRALHPYELPEVLAVPIDGGLAGYLDWLTAGSTT